MKILHTYKFEKNGVTGFVCNTDIKPDGNILETIEILNADEGKIFVNKNTGEKFTSIVILDGVNVNDYDEIEDTKND